MITFLRHGQSITNKYKTNDINPVLTYEGIQQVSGLSGHFDYIMISPLKRTIETFTHSMITGDNVEYSTLCREKMNHQSNLMHGENIYETDMMFNERIKLLKLYIQLKSKLYNHILIITHHGVVNNLIHESLLNAESITVNSL